MVDASLEPPAPWRLETSWVMYNSADSVSVSIDF